MKLTLAEPKYLKESIAIISELVTETQFKVTPDAITLVAMDPANVAMVIFKLLSSTFVEYDVKEQMTLAINLSNLKQVLRRAKPTDQLTLETGHWQGHQAFGRRKASLVKVHGEQQQRFVVVIAHAI